MAESAAGARMLLLCNPHNPIGKVYARAELQRIATIAARHDARVFADEIHAPLVYPGHRHVPYATVSADAARQDAMHSFVPPEAAQPEDTAGPRREVWWLLLTAAAIALVLALLLALRH